MASKDDEFDPNDLDSIDALLDEAEQEVAEKVPEENYDLDDLDDLDDFDFGSLSDELEGTELADIEVDPLEERTLSNEPEEPAIDVVEAAVVGVAAAAMAERPAVQPGLDSEEEFASKRSRSTKTSPNKVSVAEMDSIKKLVITFGSILIVLVITAIGIGVWSALAASSGLSDEAQNLIEDIKAGTDSNTLSNIEQAKSANEIEKKLDALSFQLEQLTADIVSLESTAKNSSALTTPVSTVTEVKPPVPTNGVTVSDVKPIDTVAPPVPSVAIDHALLQKMNVVSGKMASTQKRIDEVNRRVKDVQAKYSQLIHSIKVVEKQLVDQQTQAVKKALESEKPVNEHDQNRYQYNRAPNGMDYDQANPDSYP